MLMVRRGGGGGGKDERGGKATSGLALGVCVWGGWGVESYRTAAKFERHAAGWCGLGIVKW